MSPQEREVLKAAKAKHKSDQREYKMQQIVIEQQKKKKFERTGFFPEETILPDDYPVSWDYLYVIDEDNGKVVRSDVEGTIATLKRDLRALGYVFTNVHRCNIPARTTEL